MVTVRMTMSGYSYHTFSTTVTNTFMQRDSEQAIAGTSMERSVSTVHFLALDI